MEAAFRSIEVTGNKGKTIIQIRKEDDITLNSPNRKILAAPRVTFESTKSYIIIGGTTDFGLELIDWMIKRGAKKIILNSKKSTLVGYDLLCLSRWSEFKDISVEINTDNISDSEQTRNLILKATTLGSVGGKSISKRIST